MKGWKTWLAAGASVVYGIGGWIGGLHDADQASQFVIAGLALVGIGHKLDKAKAPE